MWVLVIERGKKCLRPPADSKTEAGDELKASRFAEGPDDLKKLS